MKVAVYMQTTANATVNVELSDEELERIAKDLEKSVDELTADDVTEVAEDKAYQNKPWLCHQCCKVELSDWEPPAKGDIAEITER